VSEALQRILETYKRAWETRDPELVLTVFTEDATYQEDPFDAPMKGHDRIRDYWVNATAPHRDVRFEWQRVCAAGDLHVVEWKADFTRSQRRVTLRGVMLLELRGARIARLREYWHRRDAS
jgi:uncharacterized protein (TIGR02246 family)